MIFTVGSLKQSGGVSSVLSYTDSAAGWRLSNISIASERSMPGYTLLNLYTDQHLRQVTWSFF